MVPQKELSCLKKQGQLNIRKRCALFCSESLEPPAPPPTPAKYAVVCVPLRSGVHELDIFAIVEFIAVVILGSCLRVAPSHNFNLVDTPTHHHHHHLAPFFLIFALKIYKEHLTLLRAFFLYSSERRQNAPL